MQYCAQYDPQANRLLFILTSFRDVVVRQQATTSLGPVAGSQSHAFMQTPSMPLGHENGDPVGNLLHTATTSPEKPSALMIPQLNQHSSNPTTSSPLPINVNSPTATHSGSSSSNPQDRPRASRDNSLDAFFDLARVSSNHNSGASNDGNDSHSAGDAEIDFEMLWQWPSSNASGLTPGAGSGIGFTPGGNIGIIAGTNQNGLGGQVDIQGISESSVPLFGISSAEFAGV
jgi:hypothetical protein